MRRKSKTPTTARERRALHAAETAWEASGVRYMSGQIAGLALLFVTFAENEIRLAAREHSQAADAVREASV